MTDQAAAARADRTPAALAAIAELWVRTRARNLDRVAVLEEAAAALAAGHLDDGRRRQAEAEAHRLVGVVGTFGFWTSSSLARQAEHLLGGATPLGAAEARRLAALAAALRHELAGRPALAGVLSPSTAIHSGPRLLIVDDDDELGEWLALEATWRGLRAERATSLPAARAAIDRARPDVVLLDLCLTETERDGLVLLDDLVTLVPPVPVLVLSGHADLAERVAVARLGGNRFLKKPLPAGEVLDAVTQALQSTSPRTIRVLAVDDNPENLALLDDLLSTQGYHCTTLSDPRRFLETLEECAPDLLLLDLRMPHLSGIELCRVVRADPRWRTLPVLMLTAYIDSDSIRQAFAAGADDCIGKPISGPELVGRITSRLEREQLLRSLSETDHLTGVANRRAVNQALAHLLRLADRQGQPVCLAMLDLDHFKQIDDRHGHAVGDQVLHAIGERLKGMFRGEDVVGRWGGEEFVIGLRGSHRADAVRRLEEVLAALRQEEFTSPEGDRFQVTASAGVAEYPIDGTDLLTVFQAADAALYQAKAAGRDQVLSTATG